MSLMRENILAARRRVNEAVRMIRSHLEEGADLWHDDLLSELGSAQGYLEALLLTDERFSSADDDVCVDPFEGGDGTVVGTAGGD